ncbi:MAG: hypothetical protein V1837_03215 [Candidatus Woesearchaeota archaeon]
MTTASKFANPNPNGKYLIDCPGCGKRVEHHAKGYCNNCYRRLGWKRKLIRCKACGRMRPHQAFGLCGGCHVRLHHYDIPKANNAKRLYGIAYGRWQEVTKKCASCGFDKLCSIHHLDGNRRNNESDNVVGLCPNCHKMIHMYQYYIEIKENLKKNGYQVDKVHPTSYVDRRDEIKSQK